jgi:hypothetical protein
MLQQLLYLIYVHYACDRVKVNYGEDQKEKNVIVMLVCLFIVNDVKVGDPVQDHQCWIRPENMQTPRTVLRIDENTPGTEIAAETAAAMAASSIVFRGTDHPYSRRLLNKAKLVFEFGSAFTFYCLILTSSGIGGKDSDQ